MSRLDRLLLLLDRLEEIIAPEPTMSARTVPAAGTPADIVQKGSSRATSEDEKDSLPRQVSSKDAVNAVMEYTDGIAHGEEVDE